MIDETTPEIYSPFLIRFSKGESIKYPRSNVKGHRYFATIVTTVTGEVLLKVSIETFLYLPIALYRNWTSIEMSEEEVQKL